MSHDRSPNDASIPSRHDSYAADYDVQVEACDCYIAELLFGLCFERIVPGQVLLDAGIGTGLSSRLFARAGLEVHGFDFSPAMLERCREKGFAASLVLHDLERIPWPYPAQHFDHVVCCGTLHFVAELDCVFLEAARVLRAGGQFAFTTKLPAGSSTTHAVSGGFDVFSHAQASVRALLAEQRFGRARSQRCLVGDDVFVLWIAERAAL